MLELKLVSKVLHKIHIEFRNQCIFYARLLTVTLHNCSFKIQYTYSLWQIAKSWLRTAIEKGITYVNVPQVFTTYVMCASFHDRYNVP